MTVGERILATLKEKGLTQSALVCEGVTGAHISRIVHGQREPSVKAIRKIAGKLGVDAIWLETGLRSGAIVLRPGDRMSLLDALQKDLGLDHHALTEIRFTEVSPDDPRLA